LSCVVVFLDVFNLVWFFRLSVVHHLSMRPHPVRENALIYYVFVFRFLPSCSTLTLMPTVPFTIHLSSLSWLLICHLLTTGNNDGGHKRNHEQHNLRKSNAWNESGANCNSPIFSLVLFLIVYYVFIRACVWLFILGGNFVGFRVEGYFCHFGEQG